MKRTAALTLVLLVSTPSWGQPLVFAANDWCPFICDIESDQPGILVEITRAVFAGDHEVRFRQLPLARGIAETRANRTQGILGVVPEAAPDLIYPPLAAVTTQLCFFTLPDSTWRYDGGYHSYPEVSVGLVDAKAVVDQFASSFPRRLTVHGDEETALRLIRLLERRRIDVLIEEKTSIGYLLDRDPELPRLRRAGCAEAKPEYIAFSPALPDPEGLALRFSQRLERLRRDGTIDAILTDYGADRENAGGRR